MAQRREGTVIALGEKRWTIRWPLGWDDAKKRYRAKSKTIKGTRRDAERELRRILTSRDAGEYIEASKMSLAVYLDRWLTDVAKRSLRRRTFDDYKALLEREVLYLPRKKKTAERELTDLARRRLDSLHLDDFVTLYNGMDDRGLSRSIRMLHYTLRSAFGHAVVSKRLRRDPTVGVKLPKQRKREKIALTSEQVAAFRKAAVGDKHALVFDFMLGTGEGAWADLPFVRDAVKDYVNQFINAWLSVNPKK